MPDDISLNDINAIHLRSEKLLLGMRAQLSDDSGGKTLNLRFTVKQAAEMVGRSEASIRNAENNGTLAPPARRDSGQRDGYSLSRINRMRDHFGTRPFRQETDDPVILGFQNFKGGVAKSTLSVHAAQYFALRGYRVLLVDLDPQATATLMFGVNPGLDLDGDQTALPFFAHEADSLDYSVRKTYWDGLDLIPSCLELYDAEYLIAADTQNGAGRFEVLRSGVHKISLEYDIVVMDAPPALGMISLNALRAANALIIPTPASLNDYGSTVTFLKMLCSVFSQMEERGIGLEYKMVRVLAAKLNASAAQTRLRDGMKKIFGDAIFSNAMIESAEYNSAAVSMQTIYEHTGRRQSTYKRCRNNLDLVMKEIEEACRMTWPSYQFEKRRQGVA